MKDDGDRLRTDRQTDIQTNRQTDRTWDGRVGRRRTPRDAGLLRGIEN